MKEKRKKYQKLYKKLELRTQHCSVRTKMLSARNQFSFVCCHSHIVSSNFFPSLSLFLLFSFLFFALQFKCNVIQYPWSSTTTTMAVVFVFIVLKWEKNIHCCCYMMHAFKVFKHIVSRQYFKKFFFCQWIWLVLYIFVCRRPLPPMESVHSLSAKERKTQFVFK